MWGNVFNTLITGTVHFFVYTVASDKKQKQANKIFNTIQLHEILGQIIYLLSK